MCNGHQGRTRNRLTGEAWRTGNGRREERAGGKAKEMAKEYEGKNAGFAIGMGISAKNAGIAIPMGERVAGERERAKAIGSGTRERETTVEGEGIS